MPSKPNGTSLFLFTSFIRKSVRDVFSEKKDFYGFLMVFLDYKLFFPKEFEIFGSEMPSL